MSDHRVILGLLSKITINGRHQDIVLFGQTQNGNYVLDGKLKFEQPLALHKLIVNDLAQLLAQTSNISSELSAKSELFKALGLSIQ